MKVRFALNEKAYLFVNALYVALFYGFPLFCKSFYVVLTIFMAF